MDDVWTVWYASDETEDAITLTFVVKTRLEREIDRCSSSVEKGRILPSFFGFFEKN